MWCGQLCHRYIQSTQLRDLPWSQHQLPVAFRVITILYPCAALIQHSQCFMVCVGNFAFFFFKFTFDGSNQTRSSGVNLTSDWCQNVCHGTVSLYRFWLYCPKFRSSSSNFYLLSGVMPVCCVVLSLQVSGVPEEQLLVALYPGLPSTAELFILPDERSYSEHKRGSEEALETVGTLISEKLSCRLLVKTAPSLLLIC